ncbi:hypothetical protein ANRL1_03532 [Anaerolineae bacterium]|nr:hypothetical protein ANRL1_03532 [Anaerolineae bacterium]
MAIAQIHSPIRSKAKFFQNPMPPLESGDHLTRAEFERRYEADPAIKKAELVEGVVYMPSPVSAIHSETHADVIGWLSVYCAGTQGVKLHDNATVHLDTDNEVQPDALLRLETGGRSRIGADGYIEGAPELIVEIAASSAAIDLHAKKNVYRRNGVQEYIVWQVYDERIDWFELRDDEYKPMTPDENGIVHCHIFPGLWLDVNVLMDGNLAQVLSELQKGLASEEHIKFAEKLAQS